MLMGGGAGQKHCTLSPSRLVVLNRETCSGTAWPTHAKWHLTYAFAYACPARSLVTGSKRDSCRILNEIPRSQPWGWISQHSAMFLQRWASTVNTCMLTTNSRA